MKKKEDKIANAFAELMIQKINEIEADWHKPWVSAGYMGMPRNINGRHYNGMNSLMLMMLREKQGYKTPVFMTFQQAKTNGWDVKKGETGFPVELWRMIYKDEQGKKLTFDEYNNLSEDEQKRCKTYPVGMTYIVFNAEQTRMPELAPDKWQQLLDAYSPSTHLKDEEGMMKSPELDYMLKNKTWFCPINMKDSDQAYYSISKDEIVVPLKAQFKEGELFYGTLLHEMAHSTGSAERLDRFGSNKNKFGSKEYAHEELVAEMTAAMTASQLGITKEIKEDSIAYLKSWLKEMEEQPDYIRTIMADVNKACAMIQEKVMNPEVAEEMKQEAIASIDKFLEKKKEEDEQKQRIPVMTKDEMQQMTPSIKNKETDDSEKLDVKAVDDNLEQKEELPKISQDIVDGLNKVKEAAKDCAAWIIKDDTVHIIEEDALKMQSALKLTASKVQLPDGKESWHIMFNRKNLDLYLPQAVRKGCRISIYEVKTTVQEKIVDTLKNSRLYMGHLGNGISIWEEGDNEYTAHISPDRKISLYKDFSPENLQRIKMMAENGNMIVGNKGAEYLALKPLNPAERFIFQPYGAEPVQVSVEQVGERSVVCNGQMIVQPKEGTELKAEDLPFIERPKDYIVSVTGIDNIRKSLDYMIKMGIDVSKLHSEYFFDALSAAEKELSSVQKDFKSISFRITNRSTDEKTDMGIEGFSDQADKLDENRQLPRYYMRENAMLYNKPAQREMEQGLPMERSVLSQPNYVRVNGRDNLINTMDTLKDYGISFTTEAEKTIAENYEQGQIMPRAVAERDRIYLHVKQGIVNEVDCNLSEYSIDEEPLLEVQNGKLTTAGHYDRDIQNAYLVAGYSEDNKLISFIKVAPATDALQQAQRYLERMQDNMTLPEISNVRIIEVDRDFKDTIEYRMASNEEMERMIAENTHGAFNELSRLPVTRTAQQEKEENITNHINDTTMAKKSKAEEAQVQEPEAKQVNETQKAQQTAGEEQQTERKLREGAHVFQAKDKEGKIIPGIYRVMVVKDGEKSEVATITKEDRDQYFQDVKGKKDEEAEAVRKALAEKYITPEGKRIETPKAEKTEKVEGKEAEKPFIIRHASEEKAQRITEPKLYKRSDNGMYAIRCKIDGEQQMSRTFDTAHKDPKIADFNKKLVDAFFSGYKGLDADAQLRRRIDVAAIKFNDVLTAEKQELAKGMSR